MGIKKACELMNVRRQGYYEFLKRKDRPAEVMDRCLTTKIKNIFYESNRIYGARKILHKLRDQGMFTSRKRVRRLMLSAGLVPVSWRKSTRTTVSDPNAAAFEDLLRQDFRAASPNQIWVTDFTYFATDEGWLYLCSFMDLFSRRIVGWAVSDTLDRHLAIEAFRKAVSARKPGKNLIVHSDRGCQYTSWDFRREVAGCNALQSMSRPGSPYDNACAESFFKTVKVECTNRHHFSTRSHAKDVIAQYMLFYNRVRIHQSLGYLSPLSFENSFAA